MKNAALTNSEFYALLTVTTLKAIHADLCEAIKKASGENITVISNKIFAIERAIREKK